MQRPRESSTADGILARTAAALSGCAYEESAFLSFLAALGSAIPGLRGWILRAAEEGGVWLLSPEPPPFPQGALAEPRSAAAAALQGASVIEISPEARGETWAEAPYLRRIGGSWWFIPVSSPSAAGVLVLFHQEAAALRGLLHRISLAARLLRPHIELAAARSGVERQVEERTSELALFYETSRSLALAKTADDIATVLADHLGEALGLDLLGLLAFRAERHELFVEAGGEGSPAALRQFRRAMMREAATILGVGAGRVTVRVNRGGATMGGGAPARNDAGAMVHVPLQAQGRAIGLLSAQVSSPPLQELRTRLLYTISSQAALTLDRIRTMEEAGLLKMKAVLDSMSEGVLLLDRRLRVVLANPAARQLAGEIEGRPLPARLRRLGGADLAALIKALAGGTAPPPSEILLEEPQKVFHMSASPVRGLKGAFEGAVLMISDVTIQRVMQEQLAQSEKLSSLGVMISGFAHELNNPLASIMGYAQLLGERPLEGDVHRKVAAINSEASRCQRIVENLLRFARKQAPERRPVDLNSVIGAVVQLLGYQLQVDGIALDVDLEPNMMPILGDFHALQQVFVNLVQNAHHAMKQRGGRGMLRIVTRCDGLTGRAEVSDTGIGIAPENLKRIFDPFFSTKTVGQGTGLGLSIAYGTIKEHGGTIHARSRLSRGTTFTVDLPAIAAVEEAAAAPEMADAVPQRPLPGKRILVVEDEGSLAEMMCEALSAEGHHVDSAADGDTAWRMIVNDRYDLIISDIKMPNMGGRELYDAVLRTDPELARHIIFSTGDSVSSDTQAFFERIGNPHLTKPFNLSDLYRVVQKTLQHS